MKKALIGSAVLALLTSTTIAASAGTDAGQGAQKRGLFVTTESDAVGTPECKASGNPSPGSANGFVILNAPGRVGAVTKIVGEVSLKNAAPGTFAVELSVNGTCTVQGTLTTNDQGNGNFHIAFAQPAGTDYYVVLRSATGVSFASDTVTVI